MPAWLQPLWRQLFIAVILGMAMTFAYSPFDAHLLPFLLLPCWLYLVLRTNRPFWVGLAFGAGWFGAGISWVHVSIAEFGGVPLLVSLLLMALLCGYLSLYPALFAASLNRVNRFSHKQILLPILAGPVLWALFEWLRGTLLTGFSWLSLGYTQIEGVLSTLLPIMGEFGTSAVIILLCLLLTPATGNQLGDHEIEPKSNGQFSTGFVLLLVCAYLPQQWTQANDDAINIALVQGNIAQSLRWDPDQELITMAHYRTLTQPLWDTHDVIIWPEAAVPQLEVLAQDYLHALDDQGLATQTALVTGIVNYRLYNEQAFNNVIVLGDGQYQYEHAARYAKHHLLPIGEFIPFEQFLRGLAPIFDLPMSSFSRGDYIQAPLQAGPLTLATALCYEILFARQVRDNITDNTNAILTLSNDAWFGDSHGPHQHMQIARVRAKELGLPVIRSTNNGVTGIIDANGDVVNVLPQFETAVLSTTMNTVTSSTPYRRYGSLFLWGLLSVCIVLGAFVIVRYVKPKHEHSTNSDVDLNAS